jgi:hypothetical protein
MYTVAGLGFAGKPSEQIDFSLCAFHAFHSFLLSKCWMFVSGSIFFFDFYQLKNKRKYPRANLEGQKLNQRANRARLYVGRQYGWISGI